MRGIKDVKYPTIMITIDYWVVGLPLGYLLAFVFDMSATGVWLGLITGLTLDSVFLISRFLKMAKRNTL